jgi:predicted ATP-dependent protease
LKIVPVKHIDDVLEIALGKHAVLEPPKVKKKDLQEEE